MIIKKNWIIKYLVKVIFNKNSDRKDFVDFKGRVSPPPNKY